MKYMNDSGVAVKKIVESYKVPIGDLFIIHDDLDVPLGEYKTQIGKGPKVHNGIHSIEQKLGTKKFGRIRIGIENRDPENRIKGEDYVLSDFTEDEKRILKWTIQKLIHDDFFENLRYR